MKREEFNIFAIASGIAIIVFACLLIIVSFFKAALHERHMPRAEVSTNYYEVIVLDGCEYIQNMQAVGYHIIHKGNCTNSVHYR